MRRLFAVIIALIVAAGLACETGHAAKKVLEVRNVTFEGNKVYDKGDLLKLMVCRPSGLFHSNEFRQQIFEDDLQNIVNFYHDNGYLHAAILDAKVTADSADEAVDLHIRISEGVVTKIDSIGVSGNKAFVDTTLLDRVDLRPGDHLQTQKIRDGMLAMATLYADSGYLSAAVKPVVSVDSNIHVATLSFRVHEGLQYTIDSTSIRGLVRTDEHIIQRELLFHEGEVVNYSDLLESQRRLYMTGLFESVFIRPDSAADSTKKVIVIELKEKTPGEFNVGVSYGTIEKVKGKAQVQDINVAGTGRQLGSTLYASFIQQKIEISFSEPWTFKTRWRTDVVGFVNLEQQPGFDMRQYGSTLTVGHVIGRRSNVSLAFRYEDSKLSNVKSLLAVPQDYDPKVRSLTATHKIDNRDNPFNTLSGIYTEVNSELAGAFLKGTNTFIRLTGRIKYFFSFDAETAFGTAFEVGWMKAFGKSADVPLSERFYAGGPNALRSFDYQRIGPLDAGGTPLGGTVRLVWNVGEVRRAIYKFIGAVAFIDIGQVWGSPADVHLKDIRISIGPGLRVNTPLGMARLDYGFTFFPRPGEASGKLYFAMGQAF